MGLCTVGTSKPDVERDWIGCYNFEGRSLRSSLGSRLGHAKTATWSVIAMTSSKGSSLALDLQLKEKGPGSPPPGQPRMKSSVLCVVVLAVATVVFTWIGFAFRPSGASPASLPSAPQLSIAVPPNPSKLKLLSFLKPMQHGITTLVVDASGTFPNHPRTIKTIIEIAGFSGFMCSGNRSTTKSGPISGTKGEYLVSAVGREPDFLFVEFCWNTNAPFRSNGAYISAVLPRILGGLDQRGTLSRTLTLPGTSLSDYTLDGTVAPTEETLRSWVWTSSLNQGFDSQASSGLPVVASSIPALQRESNNGFYSGIFFGVAGGAALALVPAIFDILGKRKNTVEAGESSPGHRRQESKPGVG
jgi:hypothetical protein